MQVWSSYGGIKWQKEKVKKKGVCLSLTSSSFIYSKKADGRKERSHWTDGRKEGGEKREEDGERERDLLSSPLRKIITVK